MLDLADQKQYEFLLSKSEKDRKDLGQYFTNKNIAEFMASLLKVQISNETVCLLDAGAGSGILTIAAALHCLDQGQKKVHAVLYEIDDEILDSLRENLNQVQQIFERESGNFSFDIRNEDFLLARPDKTEQHFDLAIINPPYFKYNSKTSPYAKATEDLFSGNPNIYASFMAVVAASLKDNGSMVAIVPRSYANGLYFKGFRHYMNKTVSLEHIHIFRARDKLFKELSVLQENIICCYIKTQQTEYIDISASSSYQDIDQSECHSYPASLIIDTSNHHEIIRIPESLNDAEILKFVESWTSSFDKNGYYISTGPIVEHRTREYISIPGQEIDSIPLLRMHNVKALRTEWTGNNKKDGCFKLIDGYEKHVISNQFYIILKRFSSKDEKRRLIAAIHSPQIISGEFLALENHLNYIGHADGELDQIEAYGLGLLFNSTLLDRYFRSISGNTQVNATEIRLLKMPNREVVRSLGQAIESIDNLDQTKIDNLIEKYIKG